MSYRMNPFMLAHGAAAGPRMRPALTGTFAGIVGFTVAGTLLMVTGTQHELSSKFGASLVYTVEFLYGAIGGAIYGKVYRRAALDMKGGWLFGMSSGFILWMVGFAGIGPRLLGESPIIGRGAMMVLAAHFAFGITMGIVYPLIHSLLIRLAPGLPLSTNSRAR